MESESKSVMEMESDTKSVTEMESYTDKNLTEEIHKVDSFNDGNGSSDPVEEVGGSTSFDDNRGSEAVIQQIGQDQALISSNPRPFIDSSDETPLVPLKWSTKDLILGAVLCVICFLADKVRKRMQFSIQETNRNCSSEIVVLPLPKTKIGSADRLLISSGRFKRFTNSCRTMLLPKSVDETELKPGVNLGRGIFKSICSKFFLKKREISKIMVSLEKWKSLSSKFLVPLHEVIFKDHNKTSAYVVTKVMTGDLKFARGGRTLLKIWKESSKIHFSIALRHAKHVCYSVLKGIHYLNSQGMQHYDLKERNILVNRPHQCECANLYECKCPKIENCNCHELSECNCGFWEVKLADFDTLDTIQRPFNAVGGTIYHRPPEASARENQVYLKPTYDTYSFGILLLHMCVGYPNEDFNNEALKLPWNKGDSRYVMELLSLMEEAESSAEMAAIRRIIRLCTKAHYEERPTAEELLPYLSTF